MEEAEAYWSTGQRQLFVPGVKTEEFEPEFTFRDVLDSLTLSTATKPRAIPINLGESSNGPHIEVVVESLTAFYIAGAVGRDGHKLGTYEHPHWGIIGRVLKHLFSPTDQVEMVRIYLEVEPGDDPHELSLGILQPGPFPGQSTD
jgi:hypothetical protein